jgi:hypothetical protein
MYVGLQIANRLYSYTETMKVNAERGRNEQITEKYGANDFRAAVGGGYEFLSGKYTKVVLETGLLFDLLTHSHSATDDSSGYGNNNWGTFTFGIPIHFKVVLP